MNRSFHSTSPALSASALALGHNRALCIAQLVAACTSFGCRRPVRARERVVGHAQPSVQKEMRRLQLVEVPGGVPVVEAVNEYAGPVPVGRRLGGMGGSGKKTRVCAFFGDGLSPATISAR